jgi:hypothetical protein
MLHLSSHFNEFKLEIAWHIIQPKGLAIISPGQEIKPRGTLPDHPQFFVCGCGMGKGDIITSITFVMT